MYYQDEYVQCFANTEKADASKAITQEKDTPDEALPRIFGPKKHFGTSTQENSFNLSAMFIKIRICAVDCETKGTKIQSMDRKRYLEFHFQSLLFMSLEGLEYCTLFF